MGMQRFRADKATKQADGAIVWHAHWMGGPTLAKIERCRIDGTDLRRTVYTTGEPDTFYRVPAVSHWQGGDATSPTNARIVEARRCLLVAVRLLSDADHQCAMAAVGIDPDPASGE